MTFKTGSTIKLKVDQDIKEDTVLHTAMLRAVADWGNLLPDICFDPEIQYEALGIDDKIIHGNVTDVLAWWTNFKEQFRTNPSSHNTIMIVLENNGVSATGSFSRIGDVDTGLLVLPRGRLENKNRDEKEDLIRHELGHAFNVPHTQGPLMIEGPFNGQATIRNGNIFHFDLNRIEPNMDPSSTDFAKGFQEQDKHHIRNFYPYKIDGHINITVKTDLKAMNLALIGRRKTPIDLSVAQPSFDGEFNFYIEPGRYSMYLRRASQKGGQLSGVWKEPGEPSTTKEYWFRRKRGNKLIFKPATKKKHYHKSMNLRRDRIYELIIKDD